ncbi:ABC transporter ATP-binding protein [Candidatus Uabimicrobium amorphum]|uniref:ABC transporter permease n=1 Tax=Uabimicrobium amorphum TaxID=2596890 RepID=A0A5S9IQ69_UABAM|nr:ABC transporter ATP-binding protein [Candidatus Uabimicrobium amorphum]BBM86039.1 ABC transporter permease [Candidatus Uabimicrobium amorphum]
MHPVNQDTPKLGWKQFMGVYRHSGRAISLVWATNRLLTILLAGLVLLNGILPVGIAYLGKLIVDTVIMATKSRAIADQNQAIYYIVFEMILVMLFAAGQRGIRMCRALLRAQLGHRVNTMILEKALTLELTHFEDSEFYDKMTQSRRQASSRPLSLVNRTFDFLRHFISLFTYGILLWQFSGWVTLVLVAAVLPVFFAETHFSGAAFRLFRWRTPETRQQMYLETVIAREDYAKEISIFGVGTKLLDRYKRIFNNVYQEDRKLTIRRIWWGYLLGLLGTLAFYGTYIWIATAAIKSQISLGEMTMYILVFKQAQNSLSSVLSSISGMYEDNLYVSNLYDFLEEEIASPSGGHDEGLQPGDGIRFENVSFTYPNSETPAVQNISFHLPPGKKLALVGENGSGKTTLIKLLTGLYNPSSGRILFEGRDLQQWNRQSLRRRIAVIFQDFVKYQFQVGENIGVGDVSGWEDEERWQKAAEKGMAASFIQQLPQQYSTQLGRWFRGGQELSLGQWQKIALARAFMREDADIFILDEPTASIDAEAEYQMFDYIREMTSGKMTIFISHRFSTVRMADHIIILDKGQITEEGNHRQLMQQAGQYSRLFSLQAQGYQ